MYNRLPVTYEMNEKKEGKRHVESAIKIMKLIKGRT